MAKHAGWMVIGALLVLPFSVHGWGDRGHQLIAVAAARLQGGWFEDRAVTLGHLANIPDSLWKSPFGDQGERARERSTHYFNPEKLARFGFRAPNQGWEKLPRELGKIREGMSSSTPRRVIEDDDLGTAPWRIEQLFRLATESLRCLSRKKPPDAEGRRRFEGDPKGLVGAAVAGYRCDLRASAGPDLYAWTVFAGVLAHYVGDLTQPLHVVADYDGRSVGQGGLHAYYEIEVLGAYAGTLEADVEKRAASRAFQKEMRGALGFDPADRADAPLEIAFQLVRETRSHAPKLLDIDRRSALLKKSVKAGKKSGSAAQRREADNPRVLAAFREMTVRQLAAGAYVLSRVWEGIWRKAGRPDLNRYKGELVPFPHAPTFVDPGFLRGK